MTKTEKLVIKALADSLSKAVYSPTHEDWDDYAERMSATINTAIPVLEALVSDENPEQDETGN